MQPLIYLLRHGEIDKPVPRRFLGQTDLPLNDNGIRQAMVLGEHFASITFAGIFSSPLQRAVQTAALASRRTAGSITPLAALTEINLGAWEGLTVTEVRSRFPGAYEQRGLDLAKYRPAGGESFGDLAARCFPALESLAENQRGPLLIVAHAGVNRVVLSRLLHQPLQRLLEIPQDYCGVNILHQAGGHLQVDMVNLPAPCSDLLKRHDSNNNE